MRCKITKNYCIKLIISGQKVKNIIKWMGCKKNRYINSLLVSREGEKTKKKVTHKDTTI